MPMSNLSFQYQDCTKTLAEGLEEYKEHVGEKYIDDTHGMKFFAAHDATHVIFGLDTSLEQEAMLDTWAIWGTDFLRQWDLVKETFKNDQLKDLTDKFSQEFGGRFGLAKLIIKLYFKVLFIKIKIFKRTFKMTKKWEYKFPKEHLNQRICDIRSEYGVTILSPEERLINNPIERLT